MKCPYCEFENMSGADVCDGCNQSLTDLARPTGSSKLEASIIEDSIGSLRPTGPVIVAPSTPVSEAIRIMCERKIGCVLVGSAEDLLGIFSERDVLMRLGSSYEQHPARPVSEFMTPEPECLESDVPIAFAINRMALGGFRHLPITEGGRLLGMISMTDVLAHFGRYCPELLAKDSGADSLTR